MTNQILRPSYIDHYTKCSSFEKGGRLVLGTSGIGGAWGPVNAQESVDVVLFALENGISTLDTAPSYVDAELFVGQALRQWSKEIPFISTKVGRLRGEHAHDCKVDYSSETMKKSVHNSLKVLGVSQIDLLFLHEPHLVPVNQIPQIIETLFSFKEEGFVKYLGIGGNPITSFYPFIKKKYFDVVSGFLKLNASNLDACKKDLPLLKKEGIAYYAASPLHFGLLGDQFEYYLSNGPDGHGVSKKDIANAIKVKALADKYGISLPSMAQRYLFSIAEADRVVVGAKNLNQITSTLKDWQTGKLDENIFEEISSMVFDAEY